MSFVLLDYFFEYININLLFANPLEFNLLVHLKQVINFELYGI